MHISQQTKMTESTRLSRCEPANCPKQIFFLPYKNCTNGMCMAVNHYHITNQNLVYFFAYFFSISRWSRRFGVFALLRNGKNAVIISFNKKITFKARQLFSDSFTFKKWIGFYFFWSFDFFADALFLLQCRFFDELLFLLNLFLLCCVYEIISDSIVLFLDINFFFFFYCCEVIFTRKKNALTSFFRSFVKLRWISEFRI